MHSVSKLLFMLALMLGSLAWSEAPQTPRLKVGVINGYSGDWAAYGTAYQLGLRLAKVEEQVEFIFEDDQFLPAKTITAFNKLVSQDHVDVVMVGDDGTAQAIAPLAQRSHIPLLAWAGISKNLRNPDVFRLWGVPAAEIGPMLSLVKKMGARKLRALVAVHPYASFFGQSICKELGDRCVGIDEFTVDPTDIKINLLQAKSAGVDGFVLCLNPGTNGLLARQMREIGLNFMMFGCNFFENSIDWDAARGALDGATFIAPEVQKEFREMYVKATGSGAHLISAAVHYDAAKLLARLSKLSGPRRAEIIPALLAIQDYQGALGAFRAVNEDGDQHMLIHMRPYRIHDKDLVPLDE
ncbi:MAG: ABC transporter substrate-binding protein [Oligoflexia bacterium]|nr:ABC transporter substrate-binding protein [Oligoflexia bacterium]